MMDKVRYFSHLTRDVKTPADLDRAIEKFQRIARYADQRKALDSFDGNVDVSPRVTGAYIDPEIQRVYEDARHIAVRLQGESPELAEIEPPPPEANPWLGLQTVQQWCIRATRAAPAKPTAPHAPKYDDKFCRLVQTTYDECLEKGMDSKGAWNKAAETHGLKNGNAARVLCSRRLRAEH